MSARLLQRIGMRFRRHQRCPQCQANVRQTYCRKCGYDLIEESRNKAFVRPF